MLAMYHKSNYQTVSDQLTCAVKKKIDIYAELTQIDP